MNMIDWKGIRNFLLGGIIGYGSNELLRRNDEKRMRLGLFKGSALVFATYMTFTQLGPGCLKIVDNYITNDFKTKTKQMDNDLIRDTTASGKYRKLSYEELQDSIKKSMARTIDERLANTEQKIETYNQAQAAAIAKNITPIVENQKSLAESQKNIVGYQRDLLEKQKVVEETQKNIAEYQRGIKSSQNDISDNIAKATILLNANTGMIESYKDRNKSLDASTTHQSPFMVPKTENREQKPVLDLYHIVVDKSEHSLMLYSKFNDGNSALKFSYGVSIAWDNGPPAGDYLVKSINERDGELYPGVIKLTDKIVITGSGMNSEHDSEILNKKNANKTGIRLLNSNYKSLESTIENHKILVTVKD